MTPSPFSSVLFDSPRSAEPPTSSGTHRAIAFSTWPEATRVAIALSSGVNDGSAASQPCGQAAGQRVAELLRLGRDARRRRRRSAAPSRAAQSAPRSSALRHVRERFVGHEKLLVLGPAVRASS